MVTLPHCLLCGHSVFHINRSRHEKGIPTFLVARPDFGQFWRKIAKNRQKSRKMAIFGHFWPFWGVPPLRTPKRASGTPKPESVCPRDDGEFQFSRPNDRILSAPPWNPKKRHFWPKLAIFGVFCRKLTKGTALSDDYINKYNHLLHYNYINSLNIIKYLINLYKIM